MVPRVLYALVLATLPEKEVHGMESRVWLWQASKLGMAPCQARALLHMEPEYGGLGVEAWLSRATRRKAELAMQWRSGGVPEHAAQLAVMRLDHDRTHPGQCWRGIGAPGAGEVELQSPYAGEGLVGLERGLRELDVSWHDGGGERAWRRGDQRAQALLSLPAAARALLHTKEVRWLSELMAPDGGRCSRCGRSRGGRR